MKKLNCWEYTNCGRIPGGHDVEKDGICPVFAELVTDGINSGENGGRCCWVIAGTLCDNEVQGIHDEKTEKCRNCKFYKLVKQQEGKKFKDTSAILEYLKNINAQN